jgi:hypothetical protein
MDITTIEISPEEAAERLAEYETQLTTERTREDEAIAMAYRAAKRGHPIVMLSEVIKAGGFFEHERSDRRLPRLAIARSTAKACWVRSDGNALVYADNEFVRRRSSTVGTHTVRVPDILEQRPWMRSGGTQAPLIPPRHRPRASRLHLFHTLWEVESWEMIPPRDPALLRHIRGDLWTVVATWDLTDLERAVLRGAAS